VLRSHPLVADACVVGVADETWGERVAAWIEPKTSATGSSLDLDDVDAHVRLLLAAPKVPRFYHVGAGIPRNANGKVNRTRVRALLDVAAQRPRA
jgi:acyl-CoA synthetase (AMP-forming)/AMP-acid ligase II